MAKIIPLSEGAFTVDQTKKFIPFNLDKDDLQQRNKGSILVEIQPFVVITSNDILLLHTGLGFADESGQLNIHKNLAAHGINSGDVTKVLISHLHKDHTGGIARPGKNKISFENATYYINSKEWEYGLQKGLPSYHSEDFLLLKDSKQLVLTQGNGLIDDYIEYQVTGAHCPYHQVFNIRNEDKIIFYGGDVAPQLQQMKNRFKAKYDFDGAASMELRKLWWKRGEEEQWTFLFYHDIKSPLFSF